MDEEGWSSARGCRDDARGVEGAELGEVVGDDELVLAPQKPFKNVVYLLT
jgi:hypothetical protein